MTLLLPIVCAIELELLFYTYRKSWREAFLFASLSLGGLVFVITEGLSLFHALTRTGMAVAWGIVLVGLMIGLFQRKAHFQTLRLRPVMALLQWEDWLLAGGAGLIVLVTALTAWQAPPNNWDAMVYHLPRVMHWLSNVSVNFYAAHVNRQLFLNPGIEYGFLHLIGLSGGDRWVNLLGVGIWLAGALMASYLARVLGAKTRGQFYSALLCLLIPSSVLQATTPKNDLLLGLWVLAALTAFFQFMKKPSWAYALALGAAIGLAILTKTTAYVILAPLVLWFMVWGGLRLKGRLLAYGAVIALLVGLLNAPQMLRSQALYGSPLGPRYETELYHNQYYGVNVLISNSLRNLAMHLRATRGWNDMLLTGLGGVHRLIRLELSDPATTWVGYTFDLPPLRINEDETGAPLHLLLLGVAAVVLLLGAKRAENRPLLILGALILLGFLFFSAYLRWQLWQTRLMIAFVMSAAVLIGVLMGRKLPRWGSFSVGALLLLMALVCLWKNPTKPLPPVYDYNIFNLPRSLMMIYDLSLQEGYMAAMEVLERDLRCDQIGLVSDNADWEYPFWAILGEDFAHLRLEAVLVENESARYEAQDFQPCAVVMLTAERPPVIELPGGLIYQPYLETRELTIYVP